MRFTTVIQDWFRDEGGGTLVLPDGWYGRPYDNQHMLTSIDESGGALTIVLDRKLTLRFEGLRSVEARGRELVFGPFDILRFNWEGFGADTRRGTKEFQSGEAKVVSGPG